MKVHWENRIIVIINGPQIKNPYAQTVGCNLDGSIKVHAVN